MSDFKWKHFTGEIFLGCVRWYCKYGISYRDIEEMRQERSVEVDHITLYRWVQQYAPEIEKRLPWYYRPRLDENWREFRDRQGLCANICIIVMGQ